MKILIFAATEPEVAPLLTTLGRSKEHARRTTRYVHGAHQIDVLLTGVGMVATAAWGSHRLASERYDLALNLGLCGSFVQDYEPGAVVHVTSDRLSELGAEDGDRFLTVRELGLPGEDEFPFRSGVLTNAEPPPIDALTRLPAVSGITVSTAHGNTSSIADVVRRFQPAVESMEGAAFMYVCLIHEVPFAQVRAVSNIVEKRNRAVWKLPEAIDRLTLSAQEILGDL